MRTLGSSHTRRAAIGLLVVTCAVGAAITIASAARSGDRASKSPADTRGPLAAAEAHQRPVVVFDARGRGERNTGGRVAIAGLGPPPGRRTLVPLTCNRVYYSADGVGLCLERGSGSTDDSQAKVLGPD